MATVKEDDDQSVIWKRFTTTMTIDPADHGGVQKIAKEFSMLYPWLDAYYDFVYSVHQNSRWYKAIIKYLDNIFESIYFHFAIILSQTELANMQECTEMNSAATQLKSKPYPMINLYTSDIGHTQWFSYGLNNSIMSDHEKHKSQYDIFFKIIENNEISKAMEEFHEMSLMEKLKLLRAWFVACLRDILFYEIQVLCDQNKNNIFTGHVYRGECIMKQHVDTFQDILSDPNGVNQIWFGLPCFSTSNKREAAVQFFCEGRKKITSLDIVGVVGHIQFVAIPTEEIDRFLRRHPDVEVIFTAADITSLSRYQCENEILACGNCAAVVDCLRHGEGAQEFVTIDFITVNCDIKTKVNSTSAEASPARYSSNIARLIDALDALSPEERQLSREDQAFFDSVGEGATFAECFTQFEQSQRTKARLPKDRRVGSHPAREYFDSLAYIAIYEEVVRYYKTKGMVERRQFYEGLLEFLHDRLAECE